MATNYVQPGKTAKLPVTAGGESGDWDLVGDLAVVLNSDADDNDEAVCDLEGVFDLSVAGADNAGDAAVSIGDKIYADGTDLNVDATAGVFFGHALGAVASGGTAVIPVRLKQ
jgi:predicted RecA/RadA family phage recombinase